MHRIVVSILLAACAAVSGCALVIADFNPFRSEREDLTEEVVQGKGRAKILLMDISKVISAEEKEGSFGLRRDESTVARVKEELRQAAEDDEVRALLLRINSPGGTVTASDVIYDEIRRFADKRRVPVVAQIMDVGASGGYYVALAADQIIAHPTSVTGSIGVVMFSLNLHALLDKIGVRDQTLKAGERKDIGSPLREMTAAEREILQSVLDDMQARFVSLVRRRRPLLSADDGWKDGRILTAQQAVDAGLVDAIGYLDDAIAVTRRHADLQEARVVMYRRPSESSENIYSSAWAGAPQVNLIHFDLGALGWAEPRFMYLWLPGSANY